MCGIVGVKPTFGAVSRAGILPASWSLDTAGPFARSVEDVRLVLAQIVGHDRRDPGSAARRLLDGLRRRLETARDARAERIRLGVLNHPLFEIVEPRARRTYESLLDSLAGAEIELIELGLPTGSFVEGTFLALCLTEGAALHSDRLRSHSEQMSNEISSLMRFAHMIPGALVARAHQLRRHITRDVVELFRANRLDALVVPASPAPPIPLERPDAGYTRASGVYEPITWSYPRVCLLASLTGQPGLVVPITGDRPPLGVQLIGRPFLDDVLLDIGAEIEAHISLSGPDIDPALFDPTGPESGHARAEDRA
jgi:aspartyl-tRNA(Asn)/glutamyl-tRNA(Gln) amidotransferase subunit A